MKVNEEVKNINLMKTIEYGAMKVPESYEECDSTHVDLRGACNPQGKNGVNPWIFIKIAAGNLEIVSSDISVLWASAFLTNWHLSDNELVHIARSMSRSEYSKASVKVTFLNPFCVCRIYSNGRVLIMGTLTEKQAYKRLAKTVRKIKYRTKWKVQIPPSSTYNYNSMNSGSEENNTRPSTDQAHSGLGSEQTSSRVGRQSSHRTDRELTRQNRDNKSRFGLDGNGLTWKYVDNPRIFKVSESLKTFKIDQLYCKIVLKNELNLEEIYRKLDPKHINVNLFKNYLSDSDMYNNTLLFKDNLDIGMELERVLENELIASNRTSSCLVFKSGKISILGCSNRSQILYTFNQLIQHL
ncbi:uncharacterized protein TOT_030000592 [Theileria orientalis strain Shintoku]|uniref:TATA-box binding protein n=1 Tax=Theileria orientalis strain Shintoku TaxID=869250 RepID=J4DPU8_THEOR|nr:uncharacterized protein TOT_030000592 [Theileria orientalis strain Shintoku]BAM41329.1 uncharacterized protein TOT_030000592 [Theileria orientalis strain Shintoku]|eukprot:XP_009691630.1 uncharacterized protein TOT_030000592 [Theileria orientalis strain Shintoku]